MARRLGKQNEARRKRLQVRIQNVRPGNRGAAVKVPAGGTATLFTEGCGGGWGRKLDQTPPPTPRNGPLASLQLTPLRPASQIGCQLTVLSPEGRGFGAGPCPVPRPFGSRFGHECAKSQYLAESEVHPPHSVLHSSQIAGLGPLCKARSPIKSRRVRYASHTTG